MTIAEHMRRDPVTVDADASVRDAAKLMETRKVGCLVAVRGGGGRPQGILTDRDIALRVLRRGLDPDETPVAAVMESDVITLSENSTLTNAMRRMRAYGVRRLPVLGADGKLVGLFDWNDGVHVLSHELTLAARVAQAQA